MSFCFDTSITVEVKLFMVSWLQWYKKPKEVRRNGGLVFLDHRDSVPSQRRTQGNVFLLNKLSKQGTKLIRASVFLYLVDINTLMGAICAEVCTAEKWYIDLTFF